MLNLCYMRHIAVLKLRHNLIKCKVFTVYLIEDDDYNTIQNCKLRSKREIIDYSSYKVKERRKPRYFIRR